MSANRGASRESRWRGCVMSGSPTSAVMEAEDRLKMYHRNVSSRSISDSSAEPWKALANGEAGRPAQGRHAF